MSLKIGLVSLGCPKNLVDSENMLGYIGKQYEITADPQEADVIIVNTCAFIETAKEESITTILQMVQYKQQNCKAVIVAGCMAERYAQELKKEIPEVDALVGVNDWQRITEVLEAISAPQYKPTIYRQEDSLALCSSTTPRVRTTPDYLAYVKIAEGCDNACSYCIIPKIRGGYRSRALEDIVAEVRVLAAQGVKEVVLIAQDVTYYGYDLYGRLALPELLRELNGIEDLKWIRLMYLYPQSFTDELLEAIATLPKVLKYIDIPLQHIADPVLEQMNRYDTKALICELLDKIRRRIPQVCIRTTFIVGFPGETDEDFAQLCEFVERYRFDNVGVFSYSQEEDTVAGEMLEQIDENTKQERYHELMSLQAQISEANNRNLEGQILEVVLESFDLEEPDTATARSYREAPEVDGAIFVENAADYAVGDFIRVEVLQGFTYELVAEPLDNTK